MLLGRVVGQVWSTRKNRRLSGLKLLVIRPYCWYNPPHRVEHIIGIDKLDAGIGEDVLVTFGTPARWSVGDRHMPVEAAVMGIVDRCDVAHEAWEGKQEGDR